MELTAQLLASSGITALVVVFVVNWIKRRIARPWLVWLLSVVLTVVGAIGITIYAALVTHTPLSWAQLPTIAGVVFAIGQTLYGVWHAKQASGK